MHFEPTITFGNLLSILVVMVSVMAAAWRISIQLQKLQWKMDIVWKQFARDHNLNGHNKRASEDTEE